MRIVRVCFKTLSTVLVGSSLLCFVAHSQVAGRGANQAIKRPVKVADAIEMTQIGDRDYLGDWDKSGDVGLFSPDNSKFAFVTQKGDLTDDTVEYSLWVFKAAEALTSPRPELLAKLASSSNREAITNVMWLPDNENIVFLGEQPGESRQIYEVNILTKNLRKLTNHSTPIVSFAVSSSNGAVVYVAEAPHQLLISKEMRRRGFVISSQSWEDLYADRPRYEAWKELFVKTSDSSPAQRVGEKFFAYADADARFFQLDISPSSHYALFKTIATHPSPAWSGYVGRGFELQSLPLCVSGQPFSCPHQYLIADLKQHTTRPLLDAPLRPGLSPLLAWTAQDSIVMVNTLLPLDGVDNAEWKRRSRATYVAEVSLPTRTIIKIAEQQTPFKASFIQVNQARDRFVARPLEDFKGPSLELRKAGSTWTIKELIEPPIETANHLSVTLEEDINTPPRLVARDPKTNQRSVLLDLNPQFSKLTFGRVEMIQWKDQTGRTHEGSLYYPPNYTVGKRYPLIIQTHGESRERFWIDGPFQTADAAQPLANKGFLVLQMGFGVRYDKASLDEFGGMLLTSKEAPATMASYESAIDELDRRRLIERDRIGITGFSRTVYHTLYTLTHSNYAFAASVEADGVDYGYVNCLYPFLSATCEKIYGVLPYSDSLSKWGKEAPTLRLDQIKTPVLLQSISSPLGEWEIYAGLHWLKKPVEWENFYPEGVHELVKPQQRLLSQESAVDWYCFWVKGEEDPDPAKAEQYKRWRELRKLLETNGNH